MANDKKKVAEVFKEFDEKNNIMKSEIENITMSKKTGELTVFLKSNIKIQDGEVLAFQIFLQDKFRVSKAIINIEYSKNNSDNEDANETKKETVKEETKKQEEPEEESPIIVGTKRAKINEKMIKVKEVTADSGRVAITGKITRIEERELKSGKTLYSFDVFDGSSTITCKSFIEPEKLESTRNRLKEEARIELEGNAQFDPYAREVTIIANVVIEAPKKEILARMDNSEVKRVELHMHTQMSQMDGITEVSDLINRARKWGMKAIAVTDHGVVQSFPHANDTVKKGNNDIKVLYGVEAYLCPDGQTSVYGDGNIDLDTEYCVLDIETTGIPYRSEMITEIGAIKIKNGEIIDEFECFVNPEKPIPYEVVQVTHITDDMVKNAKTIDKILPEFIEFCGNDVLVAHNANFDIGFLRFQANKLGLKFENTYIDTLSLAKDLFPEYAKYKLGIIAANLGIRVDVAHRALDDVKTLVKVFNVMLEKLKEENVKKLNEIDAISAKNMNLKKLPTYHAIILAKDYVGLKNLYKLVSFSHLDYFYKKPKIPRSIYKKYSEGLIIGSACDQGELYQAILNGYSDEKIEEIARFYDYLEIQPLGNNEYLIREGILKSKDDLIAINRRIVELGEKLGKLVCATCDVHFMDPEDEIYRRILQAGQGFDDADHQAPLYLRTTEEMLDEFAYLGKDKAYEVVVTNTNKVADMCEPISPISPLKCTPYIEGCEKTIEDIAMTKAHELYGDPLPEIVETRLRKELDSIIKNGFSVMYIIAQKLVWKSNEDGYIVGSRGSVGSSLVAYMTGITEVNGLKAHYRCPNCKYSDFSDHGVKNGFDLPDAWCPNCGNKLVKDGIDIPFETFLGFNGDKEPDIDLNFSGEYQTKAHKYAEVILGKGTTFKAGTIGTIAEKTAYGYVKKYFEERNQTVSSAEINRLAKGCTGIKRTTGQHPGGVVVVPTGHEIYEFCPVQHPADDPESDIVTTHFDYHSIDKNILKFDMLGHDDPTVIRMLYDLTGIDPTKVPLDDKETMTIFSSTDALGVRKEEINSEVGTYGVPEFGTKFVRGMLVDTKPNTFEELLRISGLSHGTDVWLNNAQELINNGTITLSEAICTRDDIMIYLMGMGLPAQNSFKIMESVRKGKGLSEEQEELMRSNNVPEWYIESCKKIKYMFPKAHAAAYVINAFRIAWFKVHIPKAYYTTMYSIRADEFDSEFMIFGEKKVKEKMEEIDKLGNSATQKDKGMYNILEYVLEMYKRGITFLPIDIYKSQATKFTMEPEGIRPSLNSIAGLGGVAAESIVAARRDGEFISKEDLMKRAKVGKAVIDLLDKYGCLEGMSTSNQLSLFDALM